MLELKSEILTVRFSALGAKIVAVLFDGVDVVIGPGSDAEALASDSFTGAIMGRMAGRIAQARFPLDGRMVELVPNMGPDQLHGGPENFSTAVWAAEPDQQEVRFSLHSADGEQGYPGAVTAQACYRLEHNILSLELTATTSALTVLNLTNHAYWNLAGNERASAGSGLLQEVAIMADHYLVFNENKLPTGEIAPVQGTAYDFRDPKPVARAYDNCFCLTGTRGTLRHGLSLKDPPSKRRMEVYTTEAAIQFYTADHFGPLMPGKYGPLYQHNSIAIEPQNYPDAPNHSNFPSAQLLPEETYYHRIEWRFFK